MSTIRRRNCHRARMRIVPRYAATAGSAMLPAPMNSQAADLASCSPASASERASGRSHSVVAPMGLLMHAFRSRPLHPQWHSHPERVTIFSSRENGEIINP